MGPFGAQNPPPDPPQGRSGTGTPRGLVASERDKLKPVMDSVHGRALGIAALLVASTRFASFASVYAVSRQNFKAVWESASVRVRHSVSKGLLLLWHASGFGR